jgi:hypothetical protein
MNTSAATYQDVRTASKKLSSISYMLEEIASALVRTGLGEEANAARAIAKSCRDLRNSLDEKRGAR